jgi:hypothetical protein
LKENTLVSKIKYHIAAGADTRVDSMFSKHGAVKASNADNANLIVYLGGSDISPSLYMENEHISTYTNSDLDEKEMNVYYDALPKGKAQVGICRGGQLLHCLAGGWLYQDIDRHNISHEAFTYVGDYTRKTIVTSSHHQAMGDVNCGEVLMYSPKLATFKEGGSYISEPKGDVVYDIDDETIDIEAMAYPLHNSLSYQPHPEWSLPKSVGNGCRDLFFTFINRCLEL